MRHERWGPRRTSPDSVERLADVLFDLAGDQDVRVIEAVAAVLARQRRDGTDRALHGLREAPATRPYPGDASDADNVVRRAICRRIARRALHGSLVDPTRGATAVHRVDDSPAWSRGLLPIGVFGRFLFYRPPPRRQAAEWPGAASRRQIVDSDC